MHSNYYIEQSKTTDPAQYQDLFAELPNEVPALCKIIQGLILHHADAEMLRYKIPLHSYSEMNTRYVKNMLEKMIEKKSSPLSYPRIPADRLVGICRDMAVLLCSILRYKKIPARIRVGFVNYILPGFYLDGMCVEYWNTTLKKWCYVDARTSSEQIEKLKFQIDFDLYQLPENKFISAPHAWKMCREHLMSANRFGTIQAHGLWCVRNRLLQDLAALNKKEVLIWDTWGMMLNNNSFTEVDDNQCKILDKIAECILQNPYDTVALTKLYCHYPSVKIPKRFMIFNPLISPQYIDEKL